METSYAHRSLSQKLGVDTYTQILVIDSPDTFLMYLHDACPKIKIDYTPTTIYSYIHLFTFSQNDLLNQVPVFLKYLKKNGMLWISYPKIHSSIATNVNEHVVRQVGIGNGLVDVKVVSIDANFSSLKFVYRLKDRS